jgi:hypothetical protein
LGYSLANGYFLGLPQAFSHRTVSANVRINLVPTEKLLPLARFDELTTQRSSIFFGKSQIAVAV